MKERFVEKTFSADDMEQIQWADRTLTEYQKEGYSVTLRQLFYRGVTEERIPNTTANYQKLGKLISMAREAGWLDWAAIVDRGRSTNQHVFHTDSIDMLHTAINQFRIDKWADQPNHVEVQCEKQALEGILLPICQKLEVPFSSNKGYSSSTAHYDTGKRLQERRDRAGKIVHVIYLGDLDPSGVQMAEDVKNRLERFSDGTIHVHRIALNIDQVEHYRLPPNPAKTTDSRFEAYRAVYGDESWEIDALQPSVLAKLIEDSVKMFLDPEKWAVSFAKQEAMREQLVEMLSDQSS